MTDKRSHRRRGRIAVGALALAAVVALVLSLTSGGNGGHRAGPVRALRPGPPAEAAPPTEQLGANVGLLFNLRTYSRRQIDAQLAALARTGATLARADAAWEATEPDPPAGGVAHFQWEFDDGIAAALAAHRLRWLPVIDYSPPWARSIRGVDHSPPVSAADYASYAGALAARYGPGGSFWRTHPGLPREPVQTYEIWSEPDSAFFWKPRPAPTAYAQLYVRARAAIKSVQPQARVIIGGLTHPTAFLPALLSARPALRGHIDGVAIHPYGRDPQAVLARVRRARQTLRSLGMAGVPLYVTEFGWRTRPARGSYFAPASERPRLIFRTLAALRRTDCGLAAVLLYAWFSPERGQRNGQYWFGIDPPRPGPTPGVRAFTAALRVGRTGPSASRLCSPGPS